MQLRPYQQQLEEDVRGAWNSGARNVLAVAATGAGKCLGRGTLVLMFDGTTRAVETIRAGELLMGPDSYPRRVLSTCTGRENLYRVVPRKGDPYVVNESHILSLRRTRRRAVDSKAGTVVNIPILDYMKQTPYFRHLHKGWRTGVEWANPLPVPLDPYFLGVWLGDGNSKGTSICCGDHEVKSWLDSYAASLDMEIRYEANSVGSEMLHLIRRLGEKVGRGHHSNLIKNQLVALNLLHNKHVPHAYKVASRSDRLELLAGVIDTDGHYMNGGYYVTQVSERLLDDIIFVARSLGLAAYKSRVEKKCHNNGKWGVYWSTCIHGAINEIPCKIERKKARARLQIKSATLTRLSVEALGDGDYFGFEIDGDRLFMLGDFTVTHNTVLFSKFLSDHSGAAVAIAHRQELVAQTSLALARNGVRHRIIGSQSLARQAVSAHMAELGRSYYDPNARCAAAGVDTLVRMDKNDSWFQQVGLWVCDEGHHLLQRNKWGAAVNMFPNARGLAVTATPVRADGCGLGRHADGLIDAMVEGPPMRWLIEQGYLSEYRIYAPPSDVDVSNVPIAANGDFSNPQLRKAIHGSKTIVGDVVHHYKTAAAGKLGITFAVDIEAAKELAAAYRAAGVPAEVITGKTPDGLRADILKRFKRREILQLVNVAIFGEGYDLPAIEVVSMVSHTASFSKYAQEFGRALRPLPGKTHAIILDHCGNVIRHGLPDAPRDWSLDRRDKRSSGKTSDAIPMRTCLNVKCLWPYERVYKCCPYCGMQPEIPLRTGPEYVDGSLYELTPEILAQMRGEIAAVDSNYVAVPAGAGYIIQQAVRNRHHARQQMQAALRLAMSWWYAWQECLGRPSLDEAYRRFYLTFGIDTATAEADKLRNRICEKLLQQGIDGTVNPA
jgi:DNA repair protein RadD